MRAFNNGQPFYGSPDVERGKLTGGTDTDYFYFFCPKCGDTRILQILDYKVMADGPIEYAKDERPKARRDFIIAFELYCAQCHLHDFVKVGNTGWQGGRMKDNPWIEIEKPKP